ncbi:MAG: SPOR domain-containing protein [Magnetococcales bacterium]|nr:SPOR domain-containing protein [Magnetococcales bacterium]
MKISPNREQFILVMIMNGLFAFIVIVLAVESLISSRDRVVRVESPPASAARSEKVAERGPESNPAPVTPNVTTPHVDVKIPEALMKHPDARPSSKPVAEARSEAPKAAPKPPVMPPPGVPQPPGPTTFNPPMAGMPPPPPRPPADEPSVTKPGAEESGYSVQLGAFSSEEKANALIARLATLKLDGKPIPVSQQPIKAGGKTMYRVRMGPFNNAQRARTAAALASRQAGVDGTVLGPGH